jgi:hypothetical protein
MALIVRIDVDRPYGKQPLVRHVLSRISSDAGLPKLPWFGYLRELKVMLEILNQARARAYVFFRRCTLPCAEAMEALSAGGHEIGLHLEDSRSYRTFLAERRQLEEHLGRPVTSFSKHGSGGARFGRRHYAPYEQDKYAEWGRQSGMKFFSGNLEDPRVPIFQIDRLLCFPGAFWLEPAWRNTGVFTIGWLRTATTKSDVVMLVHPENVLASNELTEQFRNLVNTVPTRIFA